MPRKTKKEFSVLDRLVQRLRRKTVKDWTAAEHDLLLLDYFICEEFKEEKNEAQGRRPDSHQEAKQER